MAVYTTPTDPALLSPAALAVEMRSLAHSAAAYFATLNEEQASTPLAPGKWCTRLVTGHLIDSAMNNIQRSVRLSIADDLIFPGYQQNEWVATQRYDLRPWAEIKTLFLALNLHFAHIVQHLNPAHLKRIWHVDKQYMEEGDLTLGFIVEEYLAHYRHHLNHLPGYQNWQLATSN